MSGIDYKVWEMIGGFGFYLSAECDMTPSKKIEKMKKLYNELNEQREKEYIEREKANQEGGS